MSAPKSADYLTHIATPGDEPYLRSKLLDVNMRLFKANAQYRGIVLSCCDHIAMVCLTKMEDYKLPHGCSGANVGIPFNIIAIARKRGAADAYAQVMINPQITEYGSTKVVSQSNCGSIRLAAPIKVARSDYVHVRWYDTTGTLCEQTFDQDDCGLTIQHEVDHNLGILITDREVKS